MKDCIFTQGTTSPDETLPFPISLFQFRMTVPPDPAYAHMSGVSKSLGGWCGTMVRLAEPEKFQI